MNLAVSLYIVGERNLLARSQKARGKNTKVGKEKGHLMVKKTLCLEEAFRQNLKPEKVSRTEMSDDVSIGETEIVLCVTPLQHTGADSRCRQAW